MKKRLQLQLDLKALVSTLISDPNCRKELEEQLKTFPAWPINEPVGQINFGTKVQPKVYTLFLLDDPDKREGTAGYIKRSEGSIVLELTPPAKDHRATLGQVLSKKSNKKTVAVPTAKELAERNVN